MNLIAPLASSILPWIVPGYPGISLFTSREKARRLTCTEMDTDAAAREYPGQIEPERPRGDYVARRTIVCREQLLPSGTRAERQSAVLMRLEDTAVEVARHVSARESPLRSC